MASYYYTVQYCPSFDERVTIGWLTADESTVLHSKVAPFDRLMSLCGEKTLGGLHMIMIGFEREIERGLSVMECDRRVKEYMNSIQLTSKRGSILTPDKLIERMECK